MGLAFEQYVIHVQRVIWQHQWYITIPLGNNYFKQINLKIFSGCARKKNKKKKQRSSFKPLIFPVSVACETASFTAVGGLGIFKMDFHFKMSQTEKTTCVTFLSLSLSIVNTKMGCLSIRRKLNFDMLRKCNDYFRDYR